jgi:hypothetical protein
VSRKPPSEVGCTEKSSTLVEYRDGMAFFRQIDVHLVNEASKAKAAAVTGQPQPRFTDRDEALNQLTAAVAVCIEAGLTDIPLLVQQIIDEAELKTNTETALI